MAPPHSARPLSTQTQPDGLPLRHVLASLADALVDARPTDREALRARIRNTVAAHGELLEGQDDLRRLLRHILNDLGGDGAPVDTIYYARQLIVVADRLPN